MANSNSLTNILQKILARGLVPLRESSTYVHTAAQDYSTEAAKPGTVVNVPKSLGAGNTAPIVPGVTDTTPADTDFGNVAIPLSNWQRSDAFFLSSKEMREVDQNEHFLPLTVTEQVRGLTNFVNGKIASNYVDVYGAVGTAGTDPFGSTSDIAVDARKLLKDQLSQGGWFGIIDHAAEASFMKLGDFKDADKTGENGVKISGLMGDKFGITWMTDHNVPTHTAGTAASTLVAQADHAIGDTTVTVDTGTGTLVVGDIFTVAGDTQQYVVTVAHAAVSTGTVTYEPPAKTAFADNAAFTHVASHGVNLIMQRGAFQYAQRPAEVLGDVMTGGKSNIIRATVRDKVSGLMLSIQRFEQYRQTAWELDVLFGTKGVRPEYAVRLMGAI